MWKLVDGAMYYYDGANKLWGESNRRVDDKVQTHEEFAYVQVYFPQVQFGATYTDVLQHCWKEADRYVDAADEKTARWR